MILRIFSLVLFLLLFLTGCGFHLRQHDNLLDHKYPAICLPNTGSHTLHQALERALSATAIKIIEEPDKKAPELRVVSEHLTAQPLVYGPDSELRRERLKMTITFSFDKNPPLVLFAERDRQLNSRQYLGDNAEKVLIENEMQADILSQLLRYLALARV